MISDDHPLPPSGTGPDASPADAGPVEVGPVEAGTVEVRPLDVHQRQALKNGRLSTLNYLKLVPAFAIGGEVGLWIVVIFRGRNFPDRGAMIFLPVLAVILLTGYFVVDRIRAGADLHQGRYARYTGPIRIDADVRKESKGPHTYYKLVLGTYKTLDLDAKHARPLQPRLTARGSADLAEHTHQLLEIRNDEGVTIFRSDALRKAIGDTAAG